MKSRTNETKNDTPRIANYLKINIINTIDLIMASYEYDEYTLLNFKLYFCCWFSNLQLA